MERIALNILSSLPMMARNNPYVLLMGDYYTKWIEAVAIPNQEAKMVVHVLLDQFICHLAPQHSYLQIRAAICLGERLSDQSHSHIYIGKRALQESCDTLNSFCNQED